MIIIIRWITHSLELSALNSITVAFNVENVLNRDIFFKYITDAWQVFNTYTKTSPPGGTVVSVVSLFASSLQTRQNPVMSLTPNQWASV